MPLVILGTAVLIASLTVFGAWTVRKARASAHRLDLVLDVSRSLPADKDVVDLGALVKGWEAVEMSHSRKRLLIAASIPAAEALTDQVQALSNDELKVMAALRG